MRTLLILGLFLFCSSYSFGQKSTYVYRDINDSMVNCYLKIVPANQKIKGIVVRDFSKLPDINKKSPYKIHDLVLQNGYVALYVTTSKKFPELGYTDKPCEMLDEIIHEVVVAHNIPRNNIFIGGISASGTRALQYTRYCAAGKSKYGIKIKGVFSVDSPLDFERFYFSTKYNGQYFTNGMAWEAAHMMKVFPEYLGTPEQNLEKYRSRSIYSQFAKNGGNAIYFKTVPMVFFHEPDLDWWLKERGAKYYDINSFDIVGFVNQTKQLGNRDVTLVTTSGKGYKNGERKCHSWSIVDEDFLMNWILARTD